MKKVFGRCGCFYAVAWVGLAGSPAANGNESVAWTGLRGPDRNATYSAVNWEPWEGDTPTIVWTAEVGNGYSEVVIFDRRAYTMGNTDGFDTVHCLNADTGEKIWSFQYPCPAERKGFYGPRSTPAVDKQFVYTMSWNGQIHCLDSQTGEAIWSKKLTDLGIEGEFGFELPNWGLSCSPLLLGETVICDLGKLMALDRNTGDIRWSTEEIDAGYSSPMAFTLDGKTCIAAFRGMSLSVFEADTGTRISNYPWSTMGNVHSAVPIIHDEMIFISSGYDVGSALLNPISPEAEIVWKNATNMSNHVNSSVLYEGYLYGIHGQVSDYGGEVRCLDITNGEVAWAAEEGLGVGALILVGDKIVLISESGELVVAKADPSSFKPMVSASVLSGPCWTAPSFARGRIYCRSSGGKVVCLNGKTKPMVPLGELAPRGFIGDTGADWNTESAVTVTASREKATREAVYTIDGSGLDPSGRFHVSHLYPKSPPPGGSPYPYHPLPECTMWLTAGDQTRRKDHGGMISGNDWIEFKFDGVYALDEIWIWNYNENNHVGRPDGVPPHFYWSAVGMRDVTIRYSTTGGKNPAHWQTIYRGEIGCANGQGKQPPNLILNCEGIKAKYVVISNTKGSRGNWVEEKVGEVPHHTGTGLSEVRFYPLQGEN